MITIRSIRELRETIQNKRAAALAGGNSAQVGFVPTMGYLHQGHVSLMERAKAETDIVVLSIFVNPLQFGPNEDFDKYPRDEARDLAVAEQAGVDIVFLPDVKEMYPSPIKTNVSVADVTSRLCGASRPGHFDGVATVVSKLFNIVQPDKAFFGLKDAQQVAVIAQMAHDLNMPLEVVPYPIVREPDGLAMSSRNVYLSPEQRREALSLSQSLSEAGRLIRGSSAPINAASVVAGIRERIQFASQSAVIDYVEVLAYPSLEPIDTIDPQRTDLTIIVALAVKFGATRLIDNAILTMGGE